MYSKPIFSFIIVLLIYSSSMQSCNMEESTSTITFKRNHERLEEKQLAHISQLTALLYLKCVNEGVKFSVSNRINSTDALFPFDDLIFVQNTGEQKTCTFIWFPLGLENCRNIINIDDFSSDGLFSIRKIYEYYLKIKEFFKFYSTKFMFGMFDNCRLVLFTHARIEDDNILGLKHAPNNSILNIGGKISVFTKTSSVIQQCIGNASDVDEFLAKLFIYHDQGHGGNISSQISDSFGTMNITSINLRNKLVTSLLLKMKEWLVKENDVPLLSDKSEYLKDIFKEEITIVNLPMETEVNKIRVKALAGYVDQLRSNISEHKTWIVYSGSGNNKPHLTTLYLVHHVLRSLGPYIFVSVTELSSSRDDILNLWQSPFCIYLVIVMDPQVSTKKVSDVCVSIKDILQNSDNSDKKVTFISSEGDHYKELNDIIKNVA